MSAVLRTLDKISENEYIVAKRKGGLGVLFISMLIYGSGSTAGFSFWLFFGSFDSTITFLYVLGFIGLGFIILIAGICLTVQYFKTPRYPVTFKKGNFYFGKKLKCNPMKLGGICGDPAKPDLYNEMKYGTMYFSINGERHKFRFVAELDAVGVTIAKIKDEYTRY
ncbi:MAG: hypothetical protein K2N22_00095, partial [Clostridia bacterium]|nr:hypothetical protein [Clostridia bacterium]